MPTPLAPADPALVDLRRKYEDKNSEAKTRWAKFDEARQAAVEAGTDLAKNADKRTELDRLHRDYEAVAKEAQALQDLVAAHLLGKHLGADGGGRLDSLTTALLKAVGGSVEGLKALTSGGAVVPAFFDPVLRVMPQRSLFVRSLIPVRQAEGELVQFIRQIVATHAAAPVAAGAEKPRSTYTVERVEEPVRVIAHVSEALDRMLLLDYEALRDFVDMQMRLGVLLAEENQIINGNGTPPNLRGVLNTPGIGSVAKGAGEPSIEALHRAITTCRLAFLEPDAIVLHPNDWQDVRLSKDADGNYLTAPVTDEGPPKLLGKEVITSPVIAEGTGIVGSFAVGATVWEREDARVSFSETGLGDTAGQELFTRNQVRFRAEERIAFGVERPAAFCAVTGI